MTQKTRVLMIGPGRGVRGGISTVVNNYFDLGMEKSVNLTYLSTMEDGSKLKKLCVAAATYLRFAATVHRYDIVHVHMAAQASFTRKALFVKKARRAGKKIIIHQHAGDFDRYYFEQVDEAKRREIRRVFAMANKVIVLSEEWADFFGKYICDADRIMILHNGVILPESPKTDYGDHRVLFLGRLCQGKGVYDLLKAIPNVLKKVPDAVFFLGGDGDKAQCIQIAEETGIGEHVRFPGWICDKDKAEALESCSVFVLPSYYEGMPMSVLEAMSYGLATLSTDVGGIPRVIRSEEDGILIKPGDISALEEQLIRLLTRQDLKQTLGTAGRKAIEKRFNAASGVQTLQKLYDQLNKR